MISAYLDRFEGDLAVLLLGEEMKKVNFPKRFCQRASARAITSRSILPTTGKRRRRPSRKRSTSSKTIKDD